MKKKLAAALMAAALTAAMEAGACADELKVWVADNVVSFTQEQIEAFKESNPEFADYDYVVEPVGEDEAADNMIKDAKTGADIYVFSQDQIARLVSADVLEEVVPYNYETVRNENDAGAVAAATVGDILYAYPMTSDNGYFLYYDKSIVSDPSTLEKILSDCEAAGKYFCMQINSGWYQTAFFFATGAYLTYDIDNDGNFISCNINYASVPGLVALKKIIELNDSSAFQNGGSVKEADNCAAIVDGTWDSADAQKLFGDNYACAKLPTFKGSDGNTYQMSGFGGFKLLGIKPQKDGNKLMACDALAKWLSDGEVQLERFKAVGWGPSNKEAQNSEVVRADEALSALADQLQYSIPQGQYPGEFWTLTETLGDSVINGELTVNTTDDELMRTLLKFQKACISYVE